jgi:hypothetical protein
MDLLPTYRTPGWKRNPRFPEARFLDSVRVAGHLGPPGRMVRLLEQV